ncbi:MAG: PAS sensor protein [Bacteroidales bacterium]|nr:PAS sensor protein [Bacteroidales bacterium]
MSDSFDHLVPDWAREFPYAITVCDTEAIILYMNDQSRQTFKDSGGDNLIGKSLFDCHSKASKEIIQELLQTGRSNIYTIEKLGRKKLICQSPWYHQGNISGLVEISILLPENMPHFIRQ